MKLGLQVGLGPDHIVLDGNPGPLPQTGTPPIFARICCGQMAQWMKMPLGRKVDLDPSDIVLDGDPAPSVSPPTKGEEPPNFRPMSIVAKQLHESRCQLVWR